MGLTVNNNYFNETYAVATSPNTAKGGAIAIYGVNVNPQAIIGNSCVNTYTMTASTLNCVYTQESDAYVLDSWWWGGLTPADPAVCTTGLCETTVAGTPAITNSLASAPILCCANSNASGCVGSTAIPDGGICQ
jgi:hypothetical protein